MALHFYKMSRKDFDDLPLREWDKDVGQFDALVILPLRKKHDSGYHMMDFVACRGGRAICRLSGHSDALLIDGLGGRGEWNERPPNLVAPVGWVVFSLPKSGLLCLSCRKAVVVGPSSSSLEIYARRKNE